MDWLDKMNNAINYMENHLENKIDYEKVAQKACCSVYHFQRMFSFITGVPLSEYVRRRRMTLSAFELQNSDIKVINLALKYGYESPEAFTRTFQACHGITPTTARNMGVSIKAYPRISFQIAIKGDVQMNYRIEKKETFTVYGIERIFESQNSEHLKALPEFWTELLKNGEHERLSKSTGENLNKKSGRCSVGAVCGYRESDGTTFPYMLCAIKTPNSNTTGYTEVNIPASTWAIFTTEFHGIEEISRAYQDLSSRIYTDWLPTSNYEILEGYEIEMYYYTKDNKYYEEAWVRVVSKK